MKRLFAINLWPYITDSHAFMSLFAASGLISAEFIIGESAIMPLLAHQETVEKVSFTPGYIQWTHLRALYGSRLDEKILAKVLPRINQCHSESFLREYNAANPEISIPNDFMNILLENCIRWGFADAHGTHLFVSRIIRFWIRYFVFFEIDCVVACMSPHSLEDLACFLVSLSLGIKTYSFVGGCMNTTFVMCWNTRSAVPLQTDYLMKREVDINVNSYFCKNNAGFLGFGRAYVGMMARENKLGMSIAKRSLIDDLLSNEADQSIAYYHFTQLVKYRRYALSCSQVRSVALNCRKTIYFPLHSQPEATTVPCAFQWYDQLKAIKYVRGKFKEEWPLFVKEHPYQFLTIGEIPARIAKPVAAHVRPAEFYDQIIELPNTYLIDLKTPMQLILEELRPVVVNITGSSGVEAYSKGLDVFQLPNTINPYGTLLENSASQSSLSIREHDAKVYCRRYSVARPSGHTLGGEIIGTGDLFEYLSFSLSDRVTRCSWASIVGFLLKSIAK